MKTTTIRELKHDTSTVLGWVEAGETVEIRRRGVPVALLQPVHAATRVRWPDFAARMASVYGETILPTTALEILDDARGER